MACARRCHAPGGGRAARIATRLLEPLEVTGLHQLFAQAAASGSAAAGARRRRGAECAASRVPLWLRRATQTLHPLPLPRLLTGRRCSRSLATILR